MLDILCIVIDIVTTVSLSASIASRVNPVTKEAPARSELCRGWVKQRGRDLSRCGMTWARAGVRVRLLPSITTQPQILSWLISCLTEAHTLDIFADSLLIYRSQSDISRLSRAQDSASSSEQRLAATFLKGPIVNKRAGVISSTVPDCYS